MSPSKKKKTSRRWQLAAIALVLAASLTLVYSCFHSRKWMVEGIAGTGAINHNDVKFHHNVLVRGVSDLPGTAVLVDHKSLQMVGKVTKAWLVRDELHVKIEISKTAPLRWQRIKDGTLQGLSVAVSGWDATDEVDPIRGAYELVHTGRVVGVSFTTRPADPRSRVLRWYKE